MERSTTSQHAVQLRAWLARPTGGTLADIYGRQALQQADCELVGLLGF